MQLDIPMIPQLQSFRTGLLRKVSPRSPAENQVGRVEVFTGCDAPAVHFRCSADGLKTGVPWSGFQIS